jgi:hypothetical protein
MRRVGILALAVATLMLSVVPAVWAQGGKPVFVDRFDDRFVEDPDLFVLDFCGIDGVRTEFHFKGSFTLYEDGSAKLHLNEDIVSTDSATGSVLLVVRNAFNVFSEPVEEIVDEDAGTLTLIFDDTFVGLPLMWMVPGEGVLIRDAGVVRFVATVVLDLETGEEISFTAEITELHGPHPFLDLSDEEIAGIFCGAMSA